jgi:pseudaminic acid synthase
LFAVRDIEAGELFTRENVRSIRPATGLPPNLLREVLGSYARRNLSRGQPLDAEVVSRN